MMELKVATLYAEMEIRKAKFERQMDELKSKLTSFQPPKFTVNLEATAAVQRLREIQDRLDAIQKAATVKVSVQGGRSGSSGSQTASASAVAPIAPTGGFFPLAGLQAAGLKYQDQLQAEADRTAAAIDRAHAKVAAAHARAEAKMIAANQKARETRQREHERTMAARARQAALDATIADPTPVFDPVPGSKQFDPSRAAAKGRLGLGVANMLQDTIQGGNPAFAINNVLGMAGDQGIKALIGDSIAAAGGLATVATVLGTVAVAAGAAFLTIDTGLKRAKLDWSDFGTVVANLGPIAAATEAFQGVGIAAEGAFKKFEETVAGSTVVGFVEGLGTGVKNIATFLDENTIGWTHATEAAKAHKEEVEGMVRAAERYNQAVKNLAQYKSPMQKEKAGVADDVGKALAKLGGEEGLSGLAAKMGAKATEFGGDQKVKVMQPGKDGKLEEVEVTRREQMTQRFMGDLNAARNLDPNAIARVTAALKQLKLSPDDFLEATKRPKDRKATAEAENQQEADYETWRQTQENNYQSKLEESQRTGQEKQDQAQSDRFWEGLERSAEKFEAEVEAAKQSQSFRLPGGISGLGLNAAEIQAKNFNDLAVAQNKMFQAPELRVASSGADFERAFQADINKGGNDEENRKNVAITREKVTELVELMKKQKGPLGAGARALLGPA